MDQRIRVCCSNDYPEVPPVQPVCAVAEPAQAEAGFYQLGLHRQAQVRVVVEKLREVDYSPTLGVPSSSQPAMNFS